MHRLYLPLALSAALLSPLEAEEVIDREVIARIKMEGFQRSQVMETLFRLTDVHGPRLHGSKNYEKAALWSRDRLREWGLDSSELESWPSTVPGWSVSDFSIELLEPSYQRLIGYPEAWTPGTGGTIEGEPVLAALSGPDDFEAHRGKLRGAIVLNGKVDASPRAAEPLEMTPQELEERRSAIDPGEPRDYWDEYAEWREEEKKELAVPRFFREEGVAAVLEPSSRGRGVVRVGSPGTFGADESPPTFVLAREHFNRLARLVQKGVPPKLRLSSTASFEPGVSGYNVIAEISGTDARLKEEVVLVGGHLDSWHSGTGATDNAAGCAVMMEALRILETIGARPRRTIRVGHWGGEEQGYWGSKHHVEIHYADLDTMELRPEHARLAAYYNLDNGTGRIRGIYLQGNESVRPIFEQFLEPFAYLGANTLTTENTSGTDHLLFDAAGLPGFSFIQDPIEYGTLTHHTNMDVYDHVREEDLKQAAVIVASVAYLTAMREEKLPRKPLPPPRSTGN
ncbi:MAG: M20/M25/M40 family metallo-hydrolase [Vicinamibacteria bacterium]